MAIAAARQQKYREQNVSFLLFCNRTIMVHNLITILNFYYALTLFIYSLNLTTPRARSVNIRYCRHHFSYHFTRLWQIQIHSIDKIEEIGLKRVIENVVI